MRLNLILLAVLVSTMSLKAQVDTIYVYGPGGPYPAMAEAAQMFSEQEHVYVKVIRGPFGQWKSAAQQNADLIYSGAEFMMTHFIGELPNIDSETVKPLYLRKSGLLVRPGNPKQIHSIKDLQNKGVSVMVVNGAGLTGVWESMIGQTRDIDQLKKLRKNIVYFAANSGVAKEQWQNQQDIDVWLTWNIWQVANAELAEFVELDDRYTIYRDCGIAFTNSAKSGVLVEAFYDFLQSEEVKPIFKKWGWLVD